MEFSKTVAFTGDPKKALEIAQVTFIQAGYKIDRAIGGRMTARHVGGFVQSQSGSGIYGASPVTVQVADGQLSITADYEGVEKARRFLWKLFAGLTAIFVVVMAIPFALLFPGKLKWLALLPLAVVVVQMPIHFLVTPRVMKRRANAALDTLMQNILAVT
jgi:hypothetical protein